MSSSTSASTFQILYFASASSYTQKNTETFPAPYPVHKLFDLLEEKYPGIKQKVLSSCAVSVSLEYVDIEELTGGDETNVTMIQPGDEVAIIPPVSSG
ncbi:hypothetical protein FQN57_004522 [Myotisia sp. PD_48]|nr:hypothetical protein FQN57_004522 [Myotisia sp. PD_48]